MSLEQTLFIQKFWCRCHLKLQKKRLQSFCDILYQETSDGIRKNTVDLVVARDGFAFFRYSVFFEKKVLIMEEGKSSRNQLEEETIENEELTSQGWSRLKKN